MRIIIGTLIAVMLGFVALLAIYVLRGVSNPFELYIVDIFNAIMGAAVVVAITGGLFQFESRVQANEQKNRLLYHEKLKLYKEVTELLTQILKDRKHSIEDFKALLTLFNHLNLVANEKVIEIVKGVLEKMESSKRTIDEEFENSVNLFLAEARRDLDVLQTVNPKSSQSLYNYQNQTKMSYVYEDQNEGNRKIFFKNLVERTNPVLFENVNALKYRHTHIGLRRKFKDLEKLHIVVLNTSLSFVIRFVEPIEKNKLAKKILDANIGFAAKTGSTNEIELVDRQFKIDGETENIVSTADFYATKLNQLIDIIE